MADRTDPCRKALLDVCACRSFEFSMTPVHGAHRRRNGKIGTEYSDLQVIRINCQTESGAGGSTSGLRRARSSDSRRFADDVDARLLACPQITYPAQ